MTKTGPLAGKIRLTDEDKYSPLGTSYRAMIQRCYDLNHERYYNYGGAGVTVCPRWLGVDGFKHFKEDMVRRPYGMTLDRIDTYGNYNKDNCKWSTAKTQRRNQRSPSRAQL
jgi:hypothetical protein